MIDLVSIGIDEYAVAEQQVVSFPNLTYGKSDAKKIAESLTRLVDVRQTLVLTCGGVGYEKATRNNIIRAISKINRDGEGAIFIYYAGHGIDLGGVFHFCPVDFDPVIAAHSSVALSLLIELASIRASWVLLVIDACRIPMGTKNTVRDEPRATLRGGTVFSDNCCVLYSCSSGQRSFETPSINGVMGGGIFTHFLCLELEKLARRGSSRIRVRDLFDSCRELVSSFVAQKNGQSQTPRAMGMDPSDLYLVSTRSKRQGARS